MDTKPLVELVSGFSYGLQTATQRELSATECAKSRRLAIEHLLDFREGLKSGQCPELMKEVYRQLIENHPEYSVLRAKGHDPNYFYAPKSRHFFLLVSDEDLIGDKRKVITDKRSIDRVVAADPILVDPSFRTVARLSEAGGYSVTALFNKGCKLQYSTTCVLETREYAPIGITKDGTMVYLANHSRDDHPMFSVKVEITNPFKRDSYLVSLQFLLATLGKKRRLTIGLQQKQGLIEVCAQPEAAIKLLSEKGESELAQLAEYLTNLPVAIKKQMPKRDLAVIVE